MGMKSMGRNSIPGPISSQQIHFEASRMIDDRCMQTPPLPSANISTIKSHLASPALETLYSDNHI